MEEWTERYRPQTLAAVRGNDAARDALAEWAETWAEHGEAVVIHGSPGVGKTSAAHALAADRGWAAMELNASDVRTKDAIERVAGRAAANHTLGTGGGRQLVIVDEADNLHHHADRGGAAAITRIVKAAAQPMVLIANEYYDLASGLRSATRAVEFRDISPRSIVPVLRDICRKEGVEFEPAALEAIAAADAGDLRAAIHDLQAAVGGGDAVTVDDVRVDGRDRGVGIFPFLDAVFKTADAHGYAEWARATEFLSNAARWIGRVYTTDRTYRWWRYAGDNVVGGVAAVREADHGGYTRYGGPPWRSRSNRTRAFVVGQLATAAGMSMQHARREVLPVLRALTELCSPRERTVRMAGYYTLDAAAVAFVTGSGKSTNKVTEIVADGQRLRAPDIVVPDTEAAGETAASADEAASAAAAPEPEEEADADTQAGLGEFL
jgi:replication factor C large subunit